MSAPANSRISAQATIRVVCAWCRVELGGGDAGPVTHGICLPCQAEFEETCDALLGKQRP